MESTSRATMTIRFMNGHVLKLEFDRHQGEPLGSTRIAEALQAQHMVIELQDRALLIPVHNIMTVDINPSPEKYPSLTIRNAKVVKPDAAQ